MATARRVTRARAERVLAQVKDRYRVYLEPLLNEDGSVLCPAIEGPVLCEDWASWGSPAPFAIVWEGGPSDWALGIVHGDPSEEDYALAESAAKEFGVPGYKPKGTKPLSIPAGVFAEPITSYALGLYDA